MLQTGCNFGLCYFITVWQSEAAGRSDIRCSCGDVANETIAANKGKCVILAGLTEILANQKD